MLSLFASVHNLITLHSTAEAIALYGAAFGTGAGLSVALCFIDAKTKERNESD